MTTTDLNSTMNSNAILTDEQIASLSDHTPTAMREPTDESVATLSEVTYLAHGWTPATLHMEGVQ